MPQLAGRVMVHTYKNGTVDGEIAFAVPRGVSEDQIYRWLVYAFGQKPGKLADGYWLSVGQRYSIKEDDEVYRRYKGMNEIATYYASMARTTAKIPGKRQRARVGIVAATLGSARDLMTPGAHEKYKRKAEIVFLRVHWNPERDKPQR